MYELNNPLKEVEQHRKMELVDKVKETHAITSVPLGVDNQSQQLEVTPSNMPPNVAISQSSEANSVELELRTVEVDKSEVLQLHEVAVDDDDVQMLEIVGGKKRDVTEVEKESKAIRRSTRKKKQQA